MKGNNHPYTYSSFLSQTQKSFSPSYSQPYGTADDIVISGIATNNYLSSSNDYRGNNSHHNSVLVIKEAGRRLVEIEQAAIQLKNGLSQSDQRIKVILEVKGSELCQKLGEYYLGQAKSCPCATHDTRQEWTKLGNKYLKYTIYDFMYEYKMLERPIIQAPLVNNQPEVIEEDQEMLNELREQLKQLKLQAEQRDQALAERDQALAERDQALADKDEIIIGLTEKNNNLVNQVGDLTIELQNQKEMNIELKNENNELKHENNELKEVNIILADKLQISESKVIPLQEKVTELKYYNKQLVDDKMELREDKKMLVDDKKMLLEEKKLLLVDKKLFQDLSHEQAIKINLLEQIHCNDPNHINLLNDNFEIIGQVELGGNLNQAE